MDLNHSSRSADARNLDDLDAPRKGRHARPEDTSFGAIPDRRTAERIAAAERTLADIHATAQGAGGDTDSLTTVFAIARDCLADIRELARDLAIGHYEWEQANIRRQDPSRLTDTASPVVPDIPGLSLCPDPSGAQTPEAFMDTLRMYRIWAGKPSYRVMEHQCARRFAASTIHAALKSNDLPRLEMVQAIITGCRGSDQHCHAFASAWRRLVMPQSASAAGRPRPRALYSVSETA
jgi:hypothetical protein